APSAPRPADDDERPRLNSGETPHPCVGHVQRTQGSREDAAMSTRNGIGTIVRWGLLAIFGGVFCGHRGGMPMRRTWLVAISGSLVLTAATLLTPGQGYAVDAHVAINCEYSSLCAEVADPGAVFGSEYVGHDEPSLAFYSDVPGAG